MIFNVDTDGNSSRTYGTVFLHLARHAITALIASSDTGSSSTIFLDFLIGSFLTLSKSSVASELTLGADFLFDNNSIKLEEVAFLELAI